MAKSVNECFMTGIFPNQLKIGAIIPIYKKGCKNRCPYYRPITKPSICAKIYEEAILSRNPS